jgi:hypothetical protein
MCLICTSFKKNELTIMEAWRNYGEMAETMEPEHSTEVFMMLLTATQEVEEPNKVPEPTLDKIKG